MTVFPSAQPHEPAARISALTGWKPVLALLAVATAIFAIGFHSEATHAVSVWLGSTAYNHCFLVLPVVGYLLSERRPIFETMAPEPALWPLLAVPLLTAAWVLAAALDINEGRELLVVAMFEVVLLSALGRRLYGQLMAPLLFLFFLVPTGAFLVPWLQTITADMTVAGLRLLKIPVFSDGYLIDIPQGRFEIAEACAGLRFLIAASVFSCLFAIIMYRSWLRRGLYIALSIAAAIGANGVRAFGMLWFADLSGSAAAVMADHILYGWMFFTLVIALLIGIGMLMAERSPRPVMPPVPSSPRGAVAGRSQWLAIPLAAILAIAGPSYVAWQNHRVPAYAISAGESPAVPADWQRLPEPAGDWRPVVDGADRALFESFLGPDGSTVTRYVGLYRLRATGNRLTAGTNRVADDVHWQIAREGRTRVEIAGQTIPVTSSEIIQGGRRSLVWSFYVVDGEIAASLLEAKLLQLRAALHQQHPLGALVVLQTGADGGIPAARRQLGQFLSGSQPFAAYIAQLQRHDQGG